MKKITLLMMLLFFICDSSFATSIEGVKRNTNGYIVYTFLANHVVKSDKKYLSDGTGNCTLIRNGSAYYMVDFFKRYSMENYVVPYLFKNGITHFKYLFLTHYHSDHCGGLVPLLESGISVDKVYLPPKLDWAAEAVVNTGDANGSKNWHDKIITYLSKNKIPWEYASNKTVSLEHGLTVQMLNADQSYLYSLTTKRPVGTNSTYSDKGVYADMNNFSVFYLFNFFGGRALFTGDANFTPLRTVGETIGKVHLWQVTHHNHDIFVPYDFLRKIKPDVSVSQDTASEHAGVKDTTIIKWAMGRYCIALGGKFYKTDGKNVVVRVSKNGAVVTETGNTPKPAEIQFTYDEWFD